MANMKDVLDQEIKEGDVLVAAGANQNIKFYRVYEEPSEEDNSLKVYTLTVENDKFEASKTTLKYNQSKIYKLDDQAFYNKHKKTLGAPVIICPIHQIETLTEF